MTDLEYLKKIVDGYLPHKERTLCLTVLNNLQFREAPGGSEHHHAYRGGLVKHTAEVMRNVIRMGGRDKVLIVAVIWHDYMKIRDYGAIDENGAIEKMPYRKLINHVAGSYAEFYRMATAMEFDQEFIEAVSHCILSHHGRREWGSPVEPLTAEAFILHAADMMSSRDANLT